MLHEKASNLNKKMDPTIPGIKHNNLQREKCFFSGTTTIGSMLFFITCYFVKFFCTPVNNFDDMLFQVLSIDRLGELSFELSLPQSPRTRSSFI